jgi:6-phosphofructokinase 1
MGAGRDTEGMSQDAPITILEVMGRNAGWLTAASALGKREERDAPHVICHPEYSIDESQLLGRVEDAYKRWGFAVMVMSENARTIKGPQAGSHSAFYTDSFGHEYIEGPARYMAKHIGGMLGVRARFEKPGTIQRSLFTCLSDTDLHEAFLVGKVAVRYALEGHTDRMITLVREPGKEYHCTTGLAPLEDVAGQEKLLPGEYVDTPSGLPTEAFIEYARPLIGVELPTFARLL